jgi:hypothetical protein
MVVARFVYSLQLVSVFSMGEESLMNLPNQSIKGT